MLRENPLWPAPEKRPCSNGSCGAETAGQRHYGHCVQLWPPHRSADLEGVVPEGQAALPALRPPLVIPRYGPAAVEPEH